MVDTPNGSVVTTTSLVKVRITPLLTVVIVVGYSVHPTHGGIEVVIVVEKPKGLVVIIISLVKVMRAPLLTVVIVVGN